MGADPLAPLAWLQGTWTGEGRGEYPTIEDFAYREEVTFARPRADKPFFAYSQRTKLADGTPSHAETGYLRATPAGAVELVLAQPTGLVEVHEGRLDGDRLELEPTSIAHTASAKEITDVRRVFERRGDELWYRIDMAAVGQPLAFHIEATLHRAD